MYLYEEVNSILFVMKQQAYATGNLTESIVAFAQFARSHGLNIGIQETQEALTSADSGLFIHRAQFKSALKAIFCHSPEECRVFEKLFILYWDTNPLDLQDENRKNSVRGVVDKKTNASLVMLGMGKRSEETEEGNNISGASEAERLKKTDLSSLGNLETGVLEEIARKLFRQMAIRLRRRMKESRRGGQINLRRTIRRSIGFGGEPLVLLRKAQRPKKTRLIVLLDVSGSMDKYSYFLLLFICALRENFRQLEAFIFSTSLIRISRALRPGSVERVLSIISEQAENWSGGTRIGTCLQTFNEKYSRQLLNGSPTIIILSDGLDTGSPVVLAGELKKMNRRSRRIIWLNPLKGTKGYEPTAGGMQAALPEVDVFRSANNLNSLLELENMIAYA
jgi:uncharacterized protein with von Willebrand factor type A (vWA) domain